MDIEFVRSRFIKHFDGETGNVYASPDALTSSENTLTITEDLFFRELLTKDDCRDKAKRHR